MLCPRRTEVGAGPASPFKLPDEDHWTDDDTCSFCGGLAPDKAIELLEQGVEVTPTDKSYKAYLRPHRKLYFQHFEVEHKRRFVELLNERKLSIAYPGHFYVLPFFVQR